MINKLFYAIVRIVLGNLILTEFFMKTNLQEKQNNFLITCQHSINENNINSKGRINIFMEKRS